MDEFHHVLFDSLKCFHVIIDTFSLFVYALVLSVEEDINAIRALKSAIVLWGNFGDLRLTMALLRSLKNSMTFWVHERYLIPLASTKTCLHGEEQQNSLRTVGQDNLIRC